MKSGGLLVVASLLIALALLLARSNSSQSVSALMLPGPDSAGRRASLVEFATTHDWAAEFAAAGISLPRSALDQIVDPLRDPSVDDSLAVVRYQIQVEFRGIDAFAPPFRATSAAVDLVQARLGLEACLIDAVSFPEPETRRNRIWAAYGHGFDARMHEWLTARRNEETDPETGALIEDLRARTEARRDR